MFGPLVRRIRIARARLDRIEQREARAIRRWLERSENVVRLSTFVFVPLLIGLVTWLSNVTPVVSFLLYPPLASGTYTLFANPSSRYASPRRFVGGVTTGALCGWVALEVAARYWYVVPPEQLQVHAGAATVSIFLTATATYLLDLEVPTAFSASLLVLVTGAQRPVYVAGVAVSSALIAGAFLLWRREVYRNRARYLFQSTTGDDQILVPVHGDEPTSRAAFAARLAAAHDSGSVVLAETVSQEAIDAAEGDLAADDDDAPARFHGPQLTAAERDAAESLVADTLVARLERLRESVRAVADVSCELVVAVEEGSRADTVLQTAEDERCDLVVCPYDSEDGTPTPYVKRLLTGPIDSVAFQPSNGRTAWRRALVMVRTSGEVANAMLDFAARLLPDGGELSACTCVSSPTERRAAERRLDSLVEAFSAPIETVIAYGGPAEVLERDAGAYDLAVIGASSDRSPASRALSPPTYERIQGLECDLAIVHRA
ncbi:HPP family protein [Halobaculum gomorrense]|uniref:HPP family protein n=1 Tax=Halobaculum gomorrense TaxID=43928 RepID=A0A1M5JN43_9EURY|nr:HPP family protein [Halobaculum gomorrense]SHG41659.1 HPP family protein [Halobaculum gomorrense]